jgi:hypothetical protein
MGVTGRVLQFAVECVVAFAIAGVLLGLAVPFLSRAGWMPGYPWNAALILGLMAFLIGVATLRPGGSLRV